MAKLKGSRPLQIKCSVLLQIIVTTLSLQQNKCTIAVEKKHLPKDIPIITNDELTISLEKVGVKRAPGLDGIPNVDLKAAIKAGPA